MIDVAFLKVLADEVQLRFAFIAGSFLLLLDYQGISILQGVFGPPLEVTSNLRPFLQALVVFDEL